MRFLLVEAAQVTVRSDQEWRSNYFHLAMRRERKTAKVDGAEIRRSPVLDDAQGMGLRAGEKVRFARSKAARIGPIAGIWRSNFTAGCLWLSTSRS